MKAPCLSFAHARATPVSFVGLILLQQCRSAAGHGHGHELPEGQYISDEAIDSILWIHVLLQILAWGIIFPTGMVLGIVRSRWHVPCQALGTLIALVAYFLGHLHGGRAFARNAHAIFATPIMLLLVVQLSLGIYLKLHVTRGILGRARGTIVSTHGWIGKVMPVIAWIQMLFGGIAALGFCRGQLFGQCMAHFSMASALVAYGVVYTLLLLAGQAWLRRTGRSQEFFDSCMIMAWGLINTVSGHSWGYEWEENDLQHVTVGILWWSGGSLGVWLSRRREGNDVGKPRRNLVPALVFILTGWAMSWHSQDSQLSTKVHAAFGYTLMVGGVTRMVDIAFVLQDRAVVDEKDVQKTHSFEYLSPFLLYASGFVFIGATHEQMDLLNKAQVSHVSYVLLMYSVAFVMYFFVNVLVYIYSSHTSPARTSANGVAVGPDNARGPNVEEFELEGLISDEEGAGSQRSTPKERRHNC